MRNKKAPVATNDLAEQVQPVGSLLPDEIPLSALVFESENSPPEWVALERRLRSNEWFMIRMTLLAYINHCYPFRDDKDILRVVPHPTLGKFRQALLRPGGVELGPIKLAFFQKIFSVPHAHTNNGTIDNSVVSRITVGQRLDALLAGEQLDSNELAALEKLLLEHARGLIQLVKQLRKKS